MSKKREAEAEDHLEVMQAPASESVINMNEHSALPPPPPHEADDNQTAGTVTAPIRQIKRARRNAIRPNSSEAFAIREVVQNILTENVTEDLVSLVVNTASESDTITTSRESESQSSSAPTTQDSSISTYDPCFSEVSNETNILDCNKHALDEETAEEEVKVH